MFFRELHKIKGKECFPIFCYKASIAMIIKQGKDATDKQTKQNKKP